MKRKIALLTAGCAAGRTARPDPVGGHVAIIGVNGSPTAAHVALAKSVGATHLRFDGYGDVAAAVRAVHAGGLAALVIVHAGTDIGAYCNLALSFARAGADIIQVDNEPSNPDRDPTRHGAELYGAILAYVHTFLHDHGATTPVATAGLAGYGSPTGVLPATVGKPVNPSDWWGAIVARYGPAFYGWFEIMARHTYRNDDPFASNPWNEIAQAKADFAKLPPGRQLVFTEVGGAFDRRDVGTPASEWDWASQLARNLGAVVAAGGTPFAFCGFDADSSDPNAQHLGLFRADGTAKPAAGVVRATAALLNQR